MGILLNHQLSLKEKYLRTRRKNESFQPEVNLSFTGGGQQKTRIQRKKTKTSDFTASTLVGKEKKKNFRPGYYFHFIQSKREGAEREKRRNPRRRRPLVVQAPLDQGRTKAKGCGRPLVGIEGRGWFRVESGLAAER